MAETDFGYTGQRDLAAVGLMDYKARWYDAGIGRFIQPDKLVLSLANSIYLNRFAYVTNNPIAYSDPTGHFACSDVFEFCGQLLFTGPITVSVLNSGLSRYGVRLTGTWELGNAYNAYFAVRSVAQKMSSVSGANDERKAFKEAFDLNDKTRIQLEVNPACSGCALDNGVRVGARTYLPETNKNGLMIHEVEFATFRKRLPCFLF
jgi:RHS repeat-associated protein